MRTGRASRGGGGASHTLGRRCVQLTRSANSTEAVRPSVASQGPGTIGGRASGSRQLSVSAGPRGPSEVRQRPPSAHLAGPSSLGAGADSASFFRLPGHSRSSVQLGSSMWTARALSSVFHRHDHSLGVHHDSTALPGDWGDRGRGPGPVRQPGAPGTRTHPRAGRRNPLSACSARSPAAPSRGALMRQDRANFPSEWTRRSSGAIYPGN